MPKGIKRYGLLGALLCLVACENTLKYNAGATHLEEMSNWHITMGAYHHNGKLTKTNEQTWVFKSHDAETKHIRDHIVFDSTLNMTIIRLNGKSLAYSISEWSDADELSSHKTYKEVTINQLRYTMLICSDWRLQAFSEEQHCTGEVPHTNHKVSNIWGAPSAITIWLPYLKQTLILKKR